MQGAIVECFSAFYRGLQATALRLNWKHQIQHKTISFYEVNKV